MRRFSAFLFAAMLVFLPCMTFAQGIVTGSIGGTVTDTTGAIVQGAQVTATSVETNQVFTTASNEAGLFLLAKMPPGKYRVTIAAPNFTKVEIAAAEVHVATATNLGQIKLSIGTATETIDVSGAATLLETTTA